MIRRIQWPPEYTQVLVWHTVQITSALVGDEKWRAIHAYMDSDEPQGFYASRTLRVEQEHMTRFSFSDANTAFDFKMKFG